MKLLAIDGNSILNRAFYGIKLLSNKKGQFTNAIFGFMNIYMRNVSDVSPDSVAVAFDLRSPTFRHKAVETYKANRTGMPPELAEQLPRVKQLLTHLMGIVCNKTRKKCDLIYFYSFPREKDIEDPRIKEVIEKVKEDAIKVFESNIIKDYCLAHNITLRFYAYDGHGTYAADKKFVYKIY